MGGWQVITNINFSCTRAGSPLFEEGLKVFSVKPNGYGKKDDEKEIRCFHDAIYNIVYLDHKKSYRNRSILLREI